MKLFSTLLLLAPAAYGSALYSLGNLTPESTPLTWTLSLDGIYDDNTSPGIVGPKDATFALDANLGAAFTKVDAQTTFDAYARVGVLHYLEEPVALGADSTYEQVRAGVTLNHSFSERLRFVSTNYLGYELEPNYVQGFASSRTASAQYLFYSTDNAIGYRWTERFGTYTGVRLSQFDLDQVINSDRFTTELYNQFRYQLSPQTVLTTDYRYAMTSGDGQSQDTNSHFFLVGAERTFNENNVLLVNAGVQIQEADRPGGQSNSSPYVEFNLNTAVNSQFNLQTFARYGSEVFDTVVDVPNYGITEYDNRLTFRTGVTGTYIVSPSVSIHSGLHLVNTSFENGRNLTSSSSVPDTSENLINAFIGASVKITDYLNANLTYNHTNSSSDLVGREFDRNRISVGVSTQF